MKYVMTDIHGMKKQFNKMMDIIHFSFDFDYLYVLGDIIDSTDKRADSLGLLDMYISQYIKSGRGCLITGNHELLCLMYLQNRLSADEWDRYSGKNTRVQVDQLSMIEKNEYIDFLSGLKHYAVEETKYGKTILTHSGLDVDYLIHNSKTGKIDVERTIQYAVAADEYKYLTSMDIHIMASEPRKNLDSYIICGHVDTGSVGKIEYEVLRTDQYMDLDVGCGYNGNSTLACYCIDTDEVFYV